MALDRLAPTSATPGAVTGDDYMDAVQEELTGLWNRVLIKLGTIAGTADAITAVATPALTGATVADGMPFILKPASNNTAAVTLKIDDGTAYAIVDKDGAALAADDLVAGRRYVLFFDSGVSKYVMLSEVGDAAAVPTSYVDKQQFTASGTWTRPARAVASSVSLIYGWGAGGGGQQDSAARYGGGGGAGYNERRIPTLSLGATETVTIPAGGAIGVTGGNASFGSWLTCYGGGAGFANGSSQSGGGGGGVTSAGVAASAGAGGAGGGPLTWTAPPNSGGGGGGTGRNGGGGGLAAGGAGVEYGGGGGSNGNAAAGSAIHGGGGGAGTGSAGTSVYGGNGGTNGVAGSAPGGGGGSNAAGGRGEIWVITYI